MGRFSHRNGYKDLPSQLKLEEVSVEFRTRILLAVQRLLNTYIRRGVVDSYLSSSGVNLFEDYWVKELRRTDAWVPDLYSVPDLMRTVINRSEFWQIFDLLEYLLANVSNKDFEPEITDAFIAERMAYRLKDKEIIAVGTEEQAETLQRSFEYLSSSNFNSSSAHLKQSAKLLAQGDFGGSLRESISAVESVARKLEPSAGTLGAALNILSKKNAISIHPALSEAFKKLYGYTSDTEGVRHALIDESEAPVSEEEALFMLGACSAFIPYLGRSLNS